jgi:hypothetical protein
MLHRFIRISALGLLTQRKMEDATVCLVFFSSFLHVSVLDTEGFQKYIGKIGRIGRQKNVGKSELICDH